MYQKFFNLQEPPFAITPDPRFLFLGRQHQAALAHLLYGIRGSSGFILLTGEVGTGKTTISRCLMQQLPNSVEVALILNPTLSPLELIASICDDLGISYPEAASFKNLFDALNQRLLANYAHNKTTVLIVDEVQNLTPALLEQVRLLSNLETDKRKLLQIVLIGQPELTTLLNRSELRPFSQRITARYHLTPLTAAETRAFVRHRLAVAGSVQPLFSVTALWLIHRAAQGIPRLINQMCDRALLAAYIGGRSRVGMVVARRAIREVLGSERARARPHRRSVRWVVLTLVCLLGLGVATRLPLQELPPSLSRPLSRVMDLPWVVSIQRVARSVGEWAVASAVSVTQRTASQGPEVEPEASEVNWELPPLPLSLATAQPQPVVAPRYAKVFEAQLVDVTEGCHLTVKETTGRVHSVQLADVYCPAADSPAGRAVHQVIGRLMQQQVRVAALPEPEGGQDVLADILDAENSLLNRALVRQGLVETTAERFQADRREARSARRGLWQAP
ncbi:MAG: AAA family ATPase [Magnetococcales bacterium]|nr:AAA family ATPase [Magnetococcales bacterium]